MIIFVDTETVPLDATPGHPFGVPPPSALVDTVPAAPPVQKSQPGNYRKPEVIARWAAEEAVRWKEECATQRAAWQVKAWKHWTSGSLDPLRAKIVCVGIAYESEHTTPAVFSEFDGIERLGDHLDYQPSPPTLCAYNCGFDRQMLVARAFAHGADDTARALLTARWVDPGETWSRAGSTWFGREHPSLGVLAAFLGLPHDHTFGGDQVLRAYLEGRHQAITGHCLDDVRTLRAVYRRLNGGGE